MKFTTIIKFVNQVFDRVTYRLLVWGGAPVTGLGPHNCPAGHRTSDLCPKCYRCACDPAGCAFCRPEPAAFTATERALWWALHDFERPEICRCPECQDCIEAEEDDGCACDEDELCEFHWQESRTFYPLQLGRPIDSCKHKGREPGEVCGACGELDRPDPEGRSAAELEHDDADPARCDCPACLEGRPGRWEDQEEEDYCPACGRPITWSDDGRCDQCEGFDPDTEE